MLTEFEQTKSQENRAIYYVLFVIICFAFQIHFSLIFSCLQRKGGVWQVMQGTDVRNKLILLTTRRKGEKTLTQQKHMGTLQCAICIDTEVAIVSDTVVSLWVG